MAKHVIIWIDRVLRAGRNGDRAAATTAYYDYTVHIAPEGEEPHAENQIHEIKGYDNFNSQILNQKAVTASAAIYADKIAKAVDAPVLRAWEHGLINYTATITVTVRAKDVETATADIKRSMATHVLASRMHFRVAE